MSCHLIEVMLYSEVTQAVVATAFSSESVTSIFFFSKNKNENLVFLCFVFRCWEKRTYSLTQIDIFVIVQGFII